MPSPIPGNRYIAGWLTLIEGSEAAFDRIAAPYIATCRAEPECRFFEMIRSRDSPQVVIVCECFTSEEAHARHLTTPHFVAFWEQLHDLALTGRFENVIAGTVQPDAYDFAARRPV